MKKKGSPRLAVFRTFKTKTKDLTGEANRQRLIISNLATFPNPFERTRTSISQKIADQHGIIWKNIYSGVFRDLDEVLIPLELVEEEGRLPLKRGPKALQEAGIPYYKLTRKGMLVALSIKEIKDRQVLLENFLSSDEEDKEFLKILLKLSKIAPSFIFFLLEKYVKAYCLGTLENLLPFNLINLRRISDESVLIQKEFIEGFSNLSKFDQEKMIKFLRNIT